MAPFKLFSHGIIRSLVKSVEQGSSGLIRQFSLRPLGTLRFIPDCSSSGAMSLQNRQEKRREADCKRLREPLLSKLLIF